MIELWNTSKGALIPDGIGSGDTSGVRQQLADAKAFRDAVPCFIDRHPLRKTQTVWHMMSHYGYGWEHELTEDSWAGMRERLKEYRENAPQYSYRAVKRNEVKEQYR